MDQIPWNAGARYSAERGASLAKQIMLLLLTGVVCFSPHKKVTCAAGEQAAA